MVNHRRHLHERAERKSRTISRTGVSASIAATANRWLITDTRNRVRVFLIDTRKRRARFRKYNFVKSVSLAVYRRTIGRCVD